MSPPALEPWIRVFLAIAARDVDDAVRGPCKAWAWSLWTMQGVGVVLWSRAVLTSIQVRLPLVRL